MENRKNYIESIKDKYDCIETVYPGDVKKGQLIFLGKLLCFANPRQIHWHRGNKLQSVEGTDILTGEKKYSKSDSFEIFNGPKKSYQLVDLSEKNQVTLLTDNNDLKDDLYLPSQNETLSNEIKNHFNNGRDIIIHVMSVLNQEIITGFGLEIPL